MTQFGDLAYIHAENHKTAPARETNLDFAAAAAGYSNTSNFIDFVQGHQDTRSFEGANQRLIWANPTYNLAGVNNSAVPEQSTAFKPNDKSAVRWMEIQKPLEASRLKTSAAQIKERGPVPSERRNVELDRKYQQARTAYKMTWQQAQTRVQEKSRDSPKRK